jgi:hypothetical protein
VQLDVVDRLPGGGEGAAQVEQELLQLAQLLPARPGQRTAWLRRLGHLVCPHSFWCQRADGGGAIDGAGAPADSCTSPTLVMAGLPGAAALGYARRQVSPADAVLTRFG